MSRSAIRSAVVIAKRPEPGLVKTRLCPPLLPHQASALAAAALHDTLDVMTGLPVRERVIALAGDPDGWVRQGWRHVAQPGGGLDERIVAAFDEVDPTGPAVLVGMDTPQLHPGLLAAFDPARFDACLGPADDGGYWAIGFADPRMARSTVLGVPMSVATTGAVQAERLQAAGLRVQLLDALVDVDTIDDARAVATAAPYSRFGRTLRAMLPLAQVG